MAIPAVQVVVSLCNGVWKGAERPIPSLPNPFLVRQSAPVHHSLTSASWSPLATLGPIKSRGRAPVSMSLQMEEAATARQAPSESEVEVRTFVEITIPPESLEGFEADYKRVAATWPADLGTTTDDLVIEQFVSSAHALARRWLPAEVVSRLESFIYNPNELPALVIRGLPIDKELPPTGLDAPFQKAGKFMSETWLVGIGRIVGQVFTYNFLRGKRPGMGLLVREIHTYPGKAENVSAEGTVLLDMHMDFFHVKPEHFPNVIAFIGLRGDRNKEGKTLLCSSQKLYRMLDPADIEVLRTQMITWGQDPERSFSKHVIVGPDSNPQINVFEENVNGMGGTDKVVQGSPEAVAAYKRVKKLASSLAEGVWLDGGDVLLLNQTKTSHGREPYTGKYDGHDRWLQRTYINSGFWKAGLTQWPSRTQSLF